MEVNRYRVKPEHKDYIEEYHKNFKEVYLTSSISLLVNWTKTLKEINIDDPDWDLKFFIVLDEDFCQPYMPFYEYINNTVNLFPYLQTVIKRYNDVMDSVEWIERI